MKKVMIGILVLIPIIVLLVIMAVGAILSMEAFIDVESIALVDADGRAVKNLVIDNLDINSDSFTFDVNDYLYVRVLPEKANNRTVTWTMEELRCLDDEYEQAYNYYLEHKTQTSKVDPVAMLVDENGLEVDSNNTGAVKISSYCSFKLKATAGIFSAYIHVDIIGYDVKKVSISPVDFDAEAMVVGETLRLSATYVPADSVVNYSSWMSDNTDVASVDANGVVVAHSVGVAHITHKASVYSSEESGSIIYVTSAPFEINVEAGASEIWGNTLTTSTKSLLLSSLGLAEGFVVEGDGGSIEGDTLTITGDSVVLKNGDKTFTITICDDDDIMIEGAELFDNQNENNRFILEVNSKPLDLHVNWASQTKTEPLGDVVWTSSNNHIATVDSNGEVKGVGEGVVTITVQAGEKSVSIELNVRHKVAYMHLEQSNIYYAVGIAEETVFGSDRYADVEHGILEPNSHLISIQGEPEEQSALADFYSAYNFEIVEGEEYAHFDESVANKLVFDGEGLEGKGRQKVVLRVSAKYPKYETMSQYTTEELTLNVVYGIQVSNAFELKEASLLQKEYAYANAVATKDYHDYDIYVSSSKQLALVLSNDIAFDAEYVDKYYSESYLNDHGEKKYGDESRINLYGSFYGNSYMLSSWKELLSEKFSELLHIAWSDVTISNVRLRPNTLNQDETTFSNDDTQGLWGDSIDAETIEDEFVVNPWGRNRLLNLRVEYCVLENGLKVSSLYNVDITYDGCVMRNIAQCGIYSPTKFNTVNVDGEDLLYPEYNHIHMNNIVASNLLGTLLSVTYNSYSVESAGVPRFGQTKDTIDQYMIDNYVSKGYNAELIQTGFLDLYNWQPASATNMLKTGNDSIDSLIQDAIGSLVNKHPDLEPYKYMAERNGNMEAYFHMGFIATGISTPNGVPSSEQVYLKFEHEDDRFRHISSRELSKVDDKSIRTYVNLFRNLDFNMYGYDNQSPITPDSVPPNGADLINHLHGRI